MKCRSCATSLSYSFCDLGHSPPSNSYLKTADQAESVFPLHAYVCHNCFLVQLGQFQLPDEMFSDYAYFSSFSQTWVEHARQYTEQVVSRFGLNSSDRVIEVASNDGYLLQHFKKKGIPILGIEPAKNVASVAEEKGIPTLNQFFGLQTALQLTGRGTKADLLIGNNVLAHVPDLNDFVSGIKTLLHPKGIATLEFPHLLQLMEQHQFDTIYHEHFSYFSLLSVETVFDRHGLELFDVEAIPTHGGSLRIYLQQKGGTQTKRENVNHLKEKEQAFGLHRIQTYSSFSQNIESIKTNIRDCLFQLQQQGKKVVGYGAPAKGNTLLNYCGIDTQWLPFTVDLSPHKQGRFLPGSRIPIYAPDKIFEYKPDYLLILPWNLQNEIREQMAAIQQWGGKFIIPIPTIEIKE